MIRFLTSGESHGPGLVTVVEGLPNGLGFSIDELAKELARRRHGYGRGQRMAIEEDVVEVLGGVRHGATLGSPVAVVIRNTEWPKWSEIMSIEGRPTGSTVTRPRPGHADLAGMLKYDTHDARDVLERASARETAARTVVGYLSKKLLELVGVHVVSHVVAIGGIESTARPRALDQFDLVDVDPVRVLDPIASEKMISAIDDAKERKDSLGGVFEVVGFGVPVGLGSHVHFDRRLDARLGQAVMSIPAIKGLEIGEGFQSAARFGSESHDEIGRSDDDIVRMSNHAGGLEGGMSNGQPIRVRAAMKPLSTLMRPLQTVDMATGEAASAVRERSDVCAVPAASVVGEQMVAYVLAGAVQEKFGGDTVGDLVDSYESYSRRVAQRLSE